MKPLLSVEEAAAMIGCTLKELRRQVIEHRALKAILVSPEGYRSNFAMGNLTEHRYIVDEEGVVTSYVDRTPLGNLRFEYLEILRYVEAENRLHQSAYSGESPRLEPVLPVDQTEQSGAPPKASPKSAVDTPLPLTTSDIAASFVGLRWKTEDEWKKPLGDKPKWLQSCIAIPGARGVSETRWDPVSIGAALVDMGHAKPNNVRAKFQTTNLLRPWLEAWKTYEAENFPNT